MLINDSPSVEWSKKAYVFNPHDRGLVLSEESEENILVNLHGLLGEPDAVQIEIASENLEFVWEYLGDILGTGGQVLACARPFQCYNPKGKTVAAFVSGFWTR